MLRRRLLDSNRLITHWRSCYRQSSSTLERAVEWARKLIQIQRTDAIVTPVVIELLVGVRSQHELRLTRAYLSQFKVIDGGRILQEDWELAKRFAARVRRDGKPRQLADCLIRAIAIRLKYEVDTDDKGFPK